MALMLTSTIGFFSQASGADPAPWTDVQVAVALNTGAIASVDSVSCVSSSFCVAGGRYYDTSGHRLAFTSVYNGSTWTDRQVASALNSGGYASVNSVSCVSSSFCAAGGLTYDASAGYQAFTSVYNGSTWTDVQVAGALNSGGNAYINSVSCVSSSFCVAGGRYRDAFNHDQAFTSVYDGSTWSDLQVAGALSTGGFSGSQSVSCVSNSFCVTGGFYVDSFSHERAFISVYSPVVAVTYAGAGGTGVAPTQSGVTQGATFNVAANSLTKSGYNFAGWSDGANTYQPGSTYTMGSSPVTLTAVWVTPPIVYSKPTAPSNVTASMNNGTATVSFTPGSFGNLATYNQIDMLINGQSVGNVCNVTGATSCPISNLGPDAAFSFTVTAINAKGSATSLVSNVVSYASPTTVPPSTTTTTTTPTTTTTTTTMPPAKQTITCVKGATSKKVTAVSPVCPAGYRKK